MSGDVTDPVDAEMAKLAAPLRRLYEDALVEREDLLVRVAANKEKLAKLKGGLKAVDPTFEPTHGDLPSRSSKPKRKKPARFVPSADILANVYVAVRENDDVTTLDLVGMLPHSNTTISYALDTLRKAPYELVRRAGRKDAQGSPYFYRVTAKGATGQADGLLEGVKLDG